MDVVIALLFASVLITIIRASHPIVVREIKLQLKDLQWFSK